MPKWQVYLFNVVIFVTGRIPLSFLNAVGDFLAWLWFDVLKVRREVVDSNLKLAFPDWSAEKREEVGRFSVQVLTRSFTQMFKIPSIDEKWMVENAVIEGEENMRQAMARGKGAYVLSMHLGCGDVGIAVFAKRGWPVVLISKKFKNRLLNDFWFYVRGSTGARFIDPHSPNNAFDILREIKNKNIVIFVLDQFMGKPFGVETKFFGHSTGTAYGLALFAQKTKSPVLPVYTYWGEDRKLHLVFEPVLEIDSLITEDKEANLAKITQKFTDVIESVVRKHPQHWMWVHKRWKVFE